MKTGSSPGEAVSSGRRGNGRANRSGADVKAREAGRLRRLANRERTSERTACLRLSESRPSTRDLTTCPDELFSRETALLAGA